MEELLPLQPHFNYLIFVVKHDEEVYDFAGAVNFHRDRFSFGTLTSPNF